MENQYRYARARFSRAIACFLFLILTMVSVANSAPAPGGSVVPEPPPPPVKAILKTSDNRPISINGVNAISGATILTGSIIETPDQTGAVISLGSAGDLELEPNSKITLEFDENGNMKVTVARGCATARTKKNIVAEFDTEQGVAGKTEPKNKKNMTVCYPPGSPVPIVTIPAGAAATGGHGLLYVFFGAISTGVIVSLFAFRGANPSPSSP